VKTPKEHWADPNSAGGPFLLASEERGMTEDLEKTIRENAAGPKRARGDQGEVESHPLADQIEADRYLSSKQAMKKGRGFRMTKISPPGA
jgi:hypothetical protein